MHKHDYLLLSQVQYAWLLCFPFGLFVKKHNNLFLHIPVTVLALEQLTGLTSLCGSERPYQISVLDPPKVVAGLEAQVVAKDS